MRRVDSRRGFILTIVKPVLETLSEHACFGGVQRFYRHQSSVIGLSMRFAVFLPPSVAKENSSRKVPALIYLAGLTCNEETFATKAHAQRHAAKLGLALVMPDTGPRGANIVGETDAWDFGLAASFYLDATVAPWSNHYRMETYLTTELIFLLAEHLPIDVTRVGIFGHSMGGHGALTLALRHRDLFRSLSAFAPICAPTQCPWGQKAFTGYLGTDMGSWAAHDASALMATNASALFPDGILIDQGLGDKFLETQLYPGRFESACALIGQPLTMRHHSDYDHGYYFISTFVDDHLEHHARTLLRD
jgi:S-formylglutathione hydrolase